MSIDEIEAAIDRCGPGKPGLIKAAHLHDVLWSKAASDCGLSRTEQGFVRDYLRAFYRPNGRERHPESHTI